jgi:hypothetical protein
MKNAKNSNGLARAAASTLKLYAPALVRPCPLYGLYDVHFYKANTKSLFHLLPQGEYCFDLQIESSAASIHGLFFFEMI